MSWISWSQETIKRVLSSLSSVCLTPPHPFLLLIQLAFGYCPHHSATENRDRDEDSGNEGVEEVKKARQSLPGWELTAGQASGEAAA